MIGKIMTGKSFRGCLLYCLNDKLKKQKEEVIFKNRAEIIIYNKCFGNEKELIQQFSEVRQLNPKLSKPVLHITLSFANGEYLNENKLASISEACAKELGFENNQFVAVIHKDTNNQHLHIVANRIGFDKRTVSDSNNYQKIANFCRKIELQYELQQVLNPKKFLSKEQGNLPRNDGRKERLKLAIRRTLFTSKNYEDFEKKMQAQGYKIIKGRGISFIDDKKVKIKGSEVGYSLNKIEVQLNFQHRLKTDKEFFKQVNKKDSARSLLKDSNTITIKDEQTTNLSELRHVASKTIEELFKPEQTFEKIQSKFLKKRKKKKHKQRV